MCKTGVICQQETFNDVQELLKGRRMILQEISQILAITRNISSSWEDKILTTIRNIFASHNGIKEQKVHEQQVNLEDFLDSPYKFEGEKK